MTEIMPVPRILSFTVLPAESFTAPDAESTLPGAAFCRIAHGIGVCRKQFHAENFFSKNSVDKIASLCYCINTLVQ